MGECHITGSPPSSKERLASDEVCSHDKPKRDERTESALNDWLFCCSVPLRASLLPRLIDTTIARIIRLLDAPPCLPPRLLNGRLTNP